MMMLSPKTAEDLKALGPLLDGSFDNLDPEAYHNGPGLSNSGLKLLHKSPAHLKSYLDGEYERREAIGTLNHMRTLERSRFDRIVIHVPNRMSKENKEKIAAAESEGKFVCTDKEYDQVSHMSDAILADEEAMELIGHKEAKFEQSHFIKTEAGTLLKCRTDILVNLPDTFAIGDLKYFDDLDDESLMWQSWRMKYHWQAAFYLHVVGLVLGKKSNFFKNIFVTSKPPYLCHCVMLHDDALRKAEMEFAPLIELYENCLTANMWPGYPKKTSIITLPEKAWM